MPSPQRRGGTARYTVSHLRTDDTVELDEQTCEQARLHRDPRFDGRIFIGVTTTGVYCRPICPSPHARRDHVRYFPTAAAAAQAGFRPCLRCRPEVAPGTPAWNGTSATVSRGLRLIAEGALDEASVDALAGRLGVTSRHLSRLFLRHLGASPTTIARTRRVHFAKQLLTDTNLTVAQIAMAAGFGSIRRFNDVFRQTYGRPPSDVRRLGRASSPSNSDEYVLRLAYRPPYDWEALLAFLAARAIPGVESVRDGVYRRTVAVRDCHGLIEVTPEPAANALCARIRLPRPEPLLQILTRVRVMFDLAADPQLIERHLSADPLLKPLVRAHPGLRLPGAWDAWELVVQALLDAHYPPPQARAILSEIVERFGTPLTAPATASLSRTFPPPGLLLTADLRGLPQPAAEMIRKAAVLLGAPSAVAKEDWLAGLIRSVPVDDPTAQYVTMRALSDPDALPADEDMLTGWIDGVGPHAAWRRRTDAWKPWRSYAVLLLLCARPATARENVVPRPPASAFGQAATHA